MDFDKCIILCIIYAVSEQINTLDTKHLAESESA